MIRTAPRLEAATRAGHKSETGLAQTWPRAVPLAGPFRGCTPWSGRAAISSHTARRCRCPPRRPRLDQPSAIGPPRRPHHQSAGDDPARPAATGQHSHRATGRERDQDRCIGRGPHPPRAQSRGGAALAAGVHTGAAGRRGSGAVVRPGAGHGHAGQHCPSRHRGDRPHPPGWPGPAAKLRHTR